MGRKEPYRMERRKKNRLLLFSLVKCVVWTQNTKSWLCVGQQEPRQRFVHTLTTFTTANTVRVRLFSWPCSLFSQRLSPRCIETHPTCFHTSEAKKKHVLQPFRSPVRYKSLPPPHTTGQTHLHNTTLCVYGCMDYAAERLRQLFKRSRSAVCHPLKENIFGIGCSLSTHRYNDNRERR